MTHPAPEVLLDLALDTLPAPEAEQAQTHLGDCPSCAEAYARLQEEQRVLTKAVGREPALPAGLRASILERVLRTAPFRKAPRTLVAAAAVVAIAAGFLMLRPDAKQQMLEQVRASELMALGLEDSQ